MNKKAVLRVLQASEIITMILMFFTGFIVIMAGVDAQVRAMFIGAMIGGVIGAALSVFRFIPRKYGTKDERTIFIEVLAEFVAILITLGIAAMSILLIAAEVISTSIMGVFIAFMIVLGIKMLTSFIFKKILDSVY